MSNYSPNIYDIKVIPDKRNTGCHGTLVDYKDYFETLEPGSGLLYIEQSTLNKYGDVISNVDFTGVTAYLAYSTYTSETVTFENCHFDSGTKDLHYGIQNAGGKVNVIARNCTFERYTSAATNANKVTLYNCYANNMTDDCFKGSETSPMYNCYARYAGTNVHAHADGFQCSVGTCVVDNYRCDGIALRDKNVYNAAIMTLDDCTGGSLSNCYLNGGGYTTYLSEGFVQENIQVGCSSNFNWYYTTGESAYNFNEYKQASTCWISSVWKESDGIHFLATNFVNSDRTITIKTNNGTYTKTIAKCPTWNEYRETYTSLDDFPFDVEFTVPNADYFVAWDGTPDVEVNQIRYVVFEPSPVPPTPSYEHTHHDINVMPDSHSCGLRDSSLLRHHTDCTDLFPVTIPEHGAIRMSAAQVTANGHYSNVFFDGVCFYPKGAPDEPFDVYFENCYFKGEYYDSNDVLQHCLAMCQGNSGFTYNYHFTNCIFDGYTNGGVTYGRNTEFVNCISRNMWQDLYKLSPGTTYTNCWGYLAGKEVGAHADGIQWSGGEPTFVIDGLRLDNYTLDPCLYANCCFYIDHEGGTVYDLDVPDTAAKNLWCNGGGYTFWIRSSGDSYSVEHFTPQNAWYGAHHHYGAKGQGATDGHSWDNTNEIPTALVSSVWKELDGIHFLATNYTSIDRNIIVRTNNGVYTKSIAHVPINEEEHSYTWETLPLDVEFIVPNADYIVCYDSSEVVANQIRYVEFTSSYVDSFQINGTLFDVYDKEALHGNLVTSIDSSSTDNDIPTAKAVYNAIPDVSGKEVTTNKVTTISSESTDTEYPSARCLYLLLGDLERLEDI